MFWGKRTYFLPSLLLSKMKSPKNAIWTEVTEGRNYSMYSKESPKNRFRENMCLRRNWTTLYTSLCTLDPLFSLSCPYSLCMRCLMVRLNDSHDIFSLNEGWARKFHLKPTATRNTHNTVLNTQNNRCWEIIIISRHQKQEYEKHTQHTRS